MLIKWQSLLTGFVAGMLLLAAPAPSRAQNIYEIRNLAWQLSQQSRESWNALRNNWNIMDRYNDPAARKLRSSMWTFNRDARFFMRQSRQSFNSFQLRDEARRLVNEASQIADLMYEANVPDWIRSKWVNVDDTVQDLAGVYNLPYDRSRALARTEYGNEDQFGYRGSMTWEGVVDGSDLIRIRANELSIQHLSARPIRDSSFNFSAPLPSANVPVFLTKMRGRGDVTLVEAPSAWNNYTATVRIDDPEGGTDSYAFRLHW